ncbi:Lipopolysaccharide biosynthesis protein [Burkholderia latens]|uniref:lipopolysaccharide biosynthesis protein n=1 Tax=Burkholderia latens TaxID=488446 RepID=UPI0039A678A8
MTSVNLAIRTSVIVNVIGKYSNILVQLVLTGMLARLLNPADFGTMAAVTVIVTFFSFVSEMGLGPAIVQFQQMKPAQMAAIFWMTVGIGTGMAMLFIASGPLVSDFYGDPQYSRIMLALGITIALTCWTIVPLALLRKAQRFGAVAMIEFASALLSGLCAVAAAYEGAGVFALVVKSAAFAGAMLMLCFCMSGYRPNVMPSLVGMRDVLSYSGYQFLFNIVNYFTRNLDKVIVGKQMGTVALGAYDAAYRLMLMPIYNLTYVLSMALQPIYSAHERNQALIFDSYRSVVRILAIVGGFVGIGCFLCSDEIIAIVYGPKWSTAAGIFSVLSVSIAIQVVSASCWPIFQALGRTDLLSLTGALSAVITLSAMAVGAYTGQLLIFSWVLVASFLVNAVIAFTILVRWGFKRRVADLFRPSLKNIAGVVLLFAACVEAKSRLATIPMPLPGMLALKVVVLSAGYGAVLFVAGDWSFLVNAVAARRKLKPSAG